eukprot:scaffold22381_cov118-Isochrysis_galbana.AAC.8
MSCKTPARIAACRSVSMYLHRGGHRSSCLNPATKQGPFTLHQGGYSVHATAWQYEADHADLQRWAGLHTLKDEVQVRVIVRLEHIEQRHNMLMPRHLLQKHDFAEGPLRVGGRQSPWHAYPWHARRYRTRLCPASSSHRTCGARVRRSPLTWPPQPAASTAAASPSQRGDSRRQVSVPLETAAPRSAIPGANIGARRPKAVRPP